MQPNYVNLAGQMARHIWFANDEVSIQFYTDAVRQLRNAERSAWDSAMPKSEEELQHIITKQHD